ncbi:hypothetical protein RCL1_007667 [Eukaryota sp. TZLM3-RCL]
MINVQEYFPVPDTVGHWVFVTLEIIEEVPYVNIYDSQSLQGFSCLYIYPIESTIRTLNLFPFNDFKCQYKQCYQQDKNDHSSCGIIALINLDHVLAGVEMQTLTLKKKVLPNYVIDDDLELVFQQLDISVQKPVQSRKRRQS